MAKISVYGYEFDEESWRKRERLEFVTLDRVYNGIDLSGLKILDGGTGVGYSAKYLAQHVGNGLVVTVDVDPSAFEMLTNIVEENVLDRIVFIKANLSRLDFIKENYFDIVNLYFTVHTIESVTPGETLQVLKEMHRVLKPGGMLVITENYPTFKPVDRAHELLIEFSRIEDKIMKALGVTARDIEYEPDQLANILMHVGFKDVTHVKISNGEIDPTLMDWVSYLARRAQEISDNKIKEEILKDIRSKLREAKNYGIRDNPSYVIYALK